MKLSSHSKQAKYSKWSQTRVSQARSAIVGCGACPRGQLGESNPDTVFAGGAVFMLIQGELGGGFEFGWNRRVPLRSGVWSEVAAHGRHMTTPASVTWTTQHQNPLPATRRAPPSSSGSRRVLSVACPGERDAMGKELDIERVQTPTRLGSRGVTPNSRPSALASR